MSARWNVFHGFVLMLKTSLPATRRLEQPRKPHMHSILYLIGVIVVILVVLSFLGIA